MPVVVTTTSGNYPQTADNRSRSELVQEIAEYSGGKSRDEQLDRALRALNSSVRDYNGRLWKFNRISEDLDLTTPKSGTNADYSLSKGFKAPIRAELVDGASPAVPSCLVEWVDWEVWKRASPDQKYTGSHPLIYTARNIHQEGVVTIDPPPASTLTYPTMRVHYFRLIGFLKTDSSVFNVPQDFEEALLLRAIARFIQKSKSFSEGREAKVEADEALGQMIRNYEDWADS